MSVVSKIFIIVNLLLTLLLVAAMATQINLKGLYKKQYKENNEAWIQSRQVLDEMESRYKTQISKLRKDDKKRGAQLAKVKTSVSNLEGGLKTKKQEVLDKVKDTNKTKSAITAMDGENKRIEGQITSLYEEIKRVRAAKDKAVETLHQTINSYYDKKRQVEDYSEPNRGN